MSRRQLEYLESIIDRNEEGDEGEKVDEGVELDARERWMFDSASRVLLVLAGPWKVLV